MGSCFSKRKKSDGALIHSFSPRSSFGMNCKDSSTTAVPAAAVTLQAKPREEMVVVLSKPASSAPRLASNNCTSHVPKMLSVEENKAPCKQEKQSNKALCEPVQQSNMNYSEQENTISFEQGKYANLITFEQREHGELFSFEQGKHENLFEQGKNMQELQCRNTGCELSLISPLPLQSIQEEFSHPEPAESSEKENQNPHTAQIQHSEEVTLFADEEIVIGEVTKETGLVAMPGPAAHGPLPLLSNLKRSRSCEEPPCSDTKRPLRHRSFQDDHFSGNSLETILEQNLLQACDDNHQSFGVTAFLEGLDLVPNKSAHKVVSSTSFDLVCHDGNGNNGNDLSLEFFELKSRYLSTCSFTASEGSSKTTITDSTMAPTVAPSLPAGAMSKDEAGAFALLHSRASSAGSMPEVPDVVDFLHSRKDSGNSFYLFNPTISSLEESESDDSDTFEFTQAVSVSSQGDMYLSSEEPRKSVSQGDLYLCFEQPRKSVSQTEMYLCLEQPRKSVCQGDKYSCLEQPRQSGDMYQCLEQSRKSVSQDDMYLCLEQSRKSVSQDDMYLCLEQSRKSVSQGDTYFFSEQPRKSVSQGDTYLCYDQPRKSLSHADMYLCTEQPRKSLSHNSEDMLLNELPEVPGSNAEEIDLIPSRPYMRSNSANAVLKTSGNDNYLQKDGADQDQHKVMGKDTLSMSVEEIILLLERDELDEEVLVSFLNSGGKSISGANTPSCPPSDVASEASFEFKVISTGSTPHSTPSTPMLSAGSTPKRISQISPLALTSEEIAEIWGVFEQRQQQQQQAYSVYQQQHHIY